MVDKDDTQPRSPFRDAPPTSQQPPVMNMPPSDDDEGMQGPGCFLWGFIGLIIFGLGVAIVLMAGAAGWTSGVRVAELDATATANRRIGQQFEQIPTDLAAGNQQVLAFRLDYLMGLTPAVPGIEDVQRSATQLAINLQPTATYTPSVTPTPTELPPEVTAEATEEAGNSAFDSSNSDSPYDLEALLLEAQDQVDLGQYDDAIDTLDVIISIDPNYRSEIVRGLMSRALRTQAANLFQSLEGIAEAINLTNRAEEFGPIGELDYERLIGGLYLDAQRTIDLGNYVSAIRSLQQIVQYQTTYKGIDITQEIFNQYVAYGDALVAGGQHCQAVAQYNNALNYFNSNSVIGKRDAAQNTCQLGISLTLTPGATLEGGGEGVAPVGQPGG